MMRSMFTAALAALALSACSPPQHAADAPPHAEALSYNLTIGPNGAAGISSALPMDVEAVRAAAANYVVAAVEDQVEGDLFTAITLSNGDGEVFRLYPTADRAHVHAIVTRSAAARGPMEEIVGETTFAVAPQEEVAFCNAELVAGEPGFACSSAEDGRFWRVYRLPDGAAESETFADIEPDLLHDATLVEMRWIAPRV